MMNLNFYKFQKEHDHYRQVAIRDNDELGVTSGTVGGKLYLSKKDAIRAYQVRDLKLALSGRLAPNTWLDQNSSLAGDYRLPQDSTFKNSNIYVENDEAAILNYSTFKNTDLKAKDCDVMIDSSDFANSKLELNGANMLASDSKFKKARIKNKGEDQLFKDATVKNTTVEKLTMAKNKTLESEEPSFDF